jgi:hypothetical protein
MTDLFKLRQDGWRFMYHRDRKAVLRRNVRTEEGPHPCIVVAEHVESEEIGLAIAYALNDTRDDDES